MPRHHGALIALLLIAPVASAQGQTATEPTKPAERNAVVGVKALFQNESDEILLVFDDRRQAWEVPGTSHEGKLTTSNLMEAMARDLGITCGGYQLGGLFTYHNPQTGTTILRPYFRARFLDYIDGAGFKEGEKTKWFSLTEAKKVIPYPASVLIVEKLLDQPERVWGGAFEEYGYTSPMTDRAAVKFRIIEDFYPLN
ncbi:MAG TPA: hypothetical protein VGW39_06840 [Chthoniobacterales bacterium]|nr:hypothetical protein [Chthoniobacterales bacterium]